MTLIELLNILSSPPKSIWHSLSEGERVYEFRDFGLGDNKIIGILEVYSETGINYHIEIWKSGNTFKCLNFNRPDGLLQVCDFIISEDRNHIFINVENTHAKIYDLTRYI